MNAEIDVARDKIFSSPFIEATHWTTSVSVAATKSMKAELAICMPHQSRYDVRKVLELAPYHMEIRTRPHQHIAFVCVLLLVIQKFFWLL